MKHTKIIILTLFALLLSIQVSFAQSFNGGLIAGATASQVDGDRYSGYHHLGYTAGAYINLPFENSFALQMEMKYSLFGAHSDVKEVENGMSPYVLHLHYAEMPLMARYNLERFHVGTKSLDFITLEAGISLDFLLKNSGGVDNEPEIESNSWRFFSATANIGIHFDLNEHWGIGVRGMYSFIPIRIYVDNTQSNLVTHFYNKVWQAVITYNLKARGR